MAVFIFLETCASHLLKDSFSSQAEQAPLCASLQGRQQPLTGLQRGSFQHAGRAQHQERMEICLHEHSTERILTATVIILTARPRCCPLPKAQNLLGEQQLCSAGAVTMSWSLPVFPALWGTSVLPPHPKAGQRAARHTDKPCAQKGYPKLVTHNSWGQLPSFN